MSLLANANHAIESYNRFVERQVEAARSDPRLRRQLLRRWKQIRSRIPTTTTPTGLTLPQLAIPQTSEPTEIARYLYAEGLPGEFPYVNAVYPSMYVQSGQAKSEEPTRLFAGLGLAEDTNARFHYLTKHQRSIR